MSDIYTVHTYDDGDHVLFTRLKLQAEPFQQYSEWAPIMRVSTPDLDMALAEYRASAEAELARIRAERKPTTAAMMHKIINEAGKLD